MLLWDTFGVDIIILDLDTVEAIILTLTTDAFILGFYLDDNPVHKFLADNLVH